MIPRSATAELIVNKFQPWIDPNKVHSILDLCTGSGCIAIACAKMFPHAIVDASDICDDALAVAKINVERHNVADQVHLVKSDLFANLTGRKYDVIISNPPYVSRKKMAILPSEYRHEPALALESQDDGLEIAIKILQQADSHLTENGILVVEVGDREKLEKRFPKIPFIWLEFEHGEGDVFLVQKTEDRGQKTEGSRFSSFL